MSSPAAHAAHAPQGFIRRYVFSLDHKVIGIQYYFLGLFSVFLGMALSRDHALPHGQSQREGGVVREALAHRRGGRRHDARTVPLAHDHARHHHGLLRADHRAAERLRQLLPAHPDRRRRHGFPGPQHDVLLDHVPFACASWCRHSSCKAALRSPAGPRIRRSAAWAVFPDPAKASARPSGSSASPSSAAPR